MNSANSTKINVDENELISEQGQIGGILFTKKTSSISINFKILVIIKVKYLFFLWFGIREYNNNNHSKLQSLVGYLAYRDSLLLQFGPSDSYR